MCMPTMRFRRGTLGASTLIKQSDLEPRAGETVAALLLAKNCWCSVPQRVDATCMFEAPEAQVDGHCQIALTQSLWLS